MVLHHIHLHLRQQRELLICSGILTSIFSIINTSAMVHHITTESTAVEEIGVEVVLIIIIRGMKLYLTLYQWLGATSL